MAVAGLPEDEQIAQKMQLKITLKRDVSGAEVFDAPSAKTLSGIAIAADGKSATTPVGGMASRRGGAGVWQARKRRRRDHVLQAVGQLTESGM